jgi:NosR/NirI family nitrous oxide reductase transcriptional regulator
VIRLRRLVFAFAAALAAAAAPARGADIASLYPQVRQFFPEADRFGALEGEPRAAPVWRGERLLGYAFLSADVVRIPAYSGKPINTLVGFDLAGRITGVSIVEHEEPILVIGITDERLRRYTDQYRGLSVFDRVAVGAPRPGHVAVDTIAGATITVMVENATIMRSARLVAESRGLRPGAGAEAAAPAADAAAASGAETAAQASPPAPAAAPQPPVSTPAPAAGTAPVAKGSAVRAPPSPPRLPNVAAREAARPAASEPAPPPAGAAATPIAEEPLWIAVWQARRAEIALLVAGLLGLATILVLQDWFARRPRLLFYVRRAFLLYTVFFVGWYALAQLSVVNVLTFVHAFMREFRWENFLIDPMLFILWSFVALTLLLWGRGVYCGWLCPFGAIQELLGQIARRFGVRQFEFPSVVHERLWAVKYLILIVLFGVSLHSLGEAVRLAEVEPFKTAVALHFNREWPFVAWAVGLIAVSLFNRKFFCKYLCALGAALSIPGRFRVFDWWLRRRKECGRPCQTCANDCEVRAIRPTGEINHNECHYCLDCQMTYYNDRKCMPLIERRLKRERRSAAATQPVEIVRPGRG